MEMRLRGPKDWTLTQRSSLRPRSVKTRRERGFFIPTATAASTANLTKLRNAPKSRGLSDSCAEPKKQGAFRRRLALYFAKFQLNEDAVPPTNPWAPNSRLGVGERRRLYQLPDYVRRL